MTLHGKGRRQSGQAARKACFRRKGAFALAVMPEVHPRERFDRSSFRLLEDPPAWQGQHPRLFFDAGDLPGLRAGTIRKPIRDLYQRLGTLPRGKAHDGVLVLEPTDAAALYTYAPPDMPEAEREEHARLCANLCLEIVSDKSVWWNWRFMCLRRSFHAVQVAIAHDLCFHSKAWEETVPDTFPSVQHPGKTIEADPILRGHTVRKAITIALHLAADILLESAGEYWPGQNRRGNNWIGVRYAGAGLCYLVSDREAPTFHHELCLSWVRGYLEDTLTRASATEGWMPEGMGYNSYPMRHVLPYAIALKRLHGIDLFAEFPGLRKCSWCLLPSVLPLSAPLKGELPTVGVHPDLTDDHPRYDHEGATAFAMALAHGEDFDYRAGARWMFDHYFGHPEDGGDGIYEVQRGSGHFALFLYPWEVPAKNPAEVWGLSYYDPSYGTLFLRNRFGETRPGSKPHGREDCVFAVVGNHRLNRGGHWGADSLSPRLLGLENIWLTGSGRTSQAAGQCALFPDEPDTWEPRLREGDNIFREKEGRQTQVQEVYAHKAGGGFVTLSAALNQTGTSAHTRRMAVDYSGRSGAEALLVIADTSRDGRFFRLNLPRYLQLERRADGFTATAPQGHRLVGTVCRPGRVEVRTGTFQRGGKVFHFGDIKITENHTLDFVAEEPGEDFLVVLALVRAGEEAPAVESTFEDGQNWSVRAGEASYALQDGRFAMEGWSPPRVELREPAPGSVFGMDDQPPRVEGRCEGEVQSLEVFCDDEPLPEQAFAEGAFTAKLPLQQPGEHVLRMKATLPGGDTYHARLI